MQKQNDTSELQFVLQDIFIIQANPQSRYKIKIVIYNHTSEEQIKHDKNIYVFKLPMDGLITNNNYVGYIQLLEKKSIDSHEDKYVQIGRGEFDLSNILISDSHQSSISIKGIIYGTRATNYDRIIAKYTYQTRSKKQLPSVIQRKNISFKDHKRKQKIPAMAFKQSIFQHTKQINEKLKELTSEINHNLKQQKDNNRKLNRLNSCLKQQIQNMAESKNEQVVYKIGQKFISLLQSCKDDIDIYRINIKNVKIYKSIDKKDNKKMSMKLNSQIYLKPFQKIQNEEIQSSKYLFSFYQIFEKQKYKRKLLDVILQIKHNQDNGYLQEYYFYVPKTTNKMKIQTFYLTQEMQSQNKRLAGKQFVPLKNKIVQFFDDENNQKGYIILHIEKQKYLPLDYLNNHKKQVNQFQKIIKQFPIHLQKVNNSSKRYSLQAVKSLLSTNLFDPKHTTRSSNRETINNEQIEYKIIEPLKISRQIRTEGSSVSIDKLQKSRISKNSNKKKHKKQIIYVQPPFVQNFSIKRNSTPPISSRFLKVRLHNLQNSNRNNLINLSISNININLYEGFNFLDKNMFLKIKIGSNQQILKLIFSLKQNELEWKTIDIKLNQIFIGDTLKLCILNSLKNDEDQLENIGECKIVVKELKQTNLKVYRSLMIQRHKIKGQIVFQFDIKQCKEVQRKQIFRNKSVINGQPIQINQGNNFNEEYELSLSNSVVNNYIKKQKKSLKMIDEPHYKFVSQGNQAEANQFNEQKFNFV